MKCLRCNYWAKLLDAYPQGLFQCQRPGCYLIFKPQEKKLILSELLKKKEKSLPEHIKRRNTIMRLRNSINLSNKGLTSGLQKRCQKSLKDYALKEDWLNYEFWRWWRIWVYSRRRWGWFLMNKAEELFEKIGFWNMPCVKISDAQLFRW